MWVHSFCNISLGGAGNFIGWSFKNISHSQYIFVQIHSITRDIFPTLLAISIYVK